MGQYWKPVNLDKREFIHPHTLGTGLKLWEQLANTPGTPAALLILQAAMPERRGGGDLAENPVIGRWAGDRVVLVGDYAEDSDLPTSPIPFSLVYGLCGQDSEESRQEYLQSLRKTYPDLVYDLPSGKLDSNTLKPFTDITEQVMRVIEHELDGKFVGTGWAEFVPNNSK